MSENRRIIWLVVLGSLVWIGITGWLLFSTLPNNAIAHIGTDYLKNRMANECTGTFQERYQCKETLIVESGQDSFWILSTRTLAVLLPPFAAGFWLTAFLKRKKMARPVYVEDPPVHDGDWKSRAIHHTDIQTPKEAARELHLDDNPISDYEPPRRIDEIAPIEDWSLKAKQHIEEMRKRMNEKKNRD